MFKRIRDNIRHNFVLKVLSIIIAIVIWYVVVSVNDPVISRSYTVDISFTNQSYIQSGKKTYRSDDIYKSATVFIRANRSTLRQIEATDIQVSADLTQIVDMETTPVMVPLTVTCPNVEPANITLARTAIPITIENIASKEFKVAVNMGDSTPGTNYEVGTATPNPEQVIINGPESIINSIDAVVAQIDVTGMTQDGARSATLRLYDKNQSEISVNTIENELTFDGGRPDVSVYVDLWKKQTDVGFTISHAGEPADGFQVGTVASTPDTVTVIGSDAALDALGKSGNKITIPAEEVSVEGAAEDVSVEVALADFLPNEIRLSANMAETLVVNVSIIPEDSREIEYDVEQITMQGLDANLTVTYDQTECTLRVRGDTDALAALKPSDITASIDLTGLGTGEHDLPVTVKVPAGIELVDKVTIPVHITPSADAE